MTKTATTTKKVKLRLVRKQDKLVSVRKLVFDKKVFKTSDEVDAWLQKNNWEDYKITEGKTSFEAAAADATDGVFKKMHQVSLNEPGITGVVGEVDADKVEDTTEGGTDTTEGGAGEDTLDGGDKGTDTVEGGETETKGATKVSKYDAWNAYFSGQTELAGVIKAGMQDGMPPGIEDVFGAAFTAMANTLKADTKDKYKKDSIKKTADDLANLVVLTYDAYTELLDSTDANAKKFVGDYDAFVTKYSKDTVKKSDEKLDKVLASVADLCNLVGSLKADLDNVKKIATDADNKSKELADTIKKKAPEKKASALDDQNTITPTNNSKDVDASRLQKRLTADLLGMRCN